MTTGTSAFLDTTIHVDRVLRRNEPEYLNVVEAICAQYHTCVTSSFSKLEFKNVVLMDLQCVAQWIEEEDSFNAAYVRAHRVQSRRSGTLSCIVAFVQRELDTTIELEQGDSLDVALTIQAKLYIHNAIEYLWYRFDEDFDSIVDNMQCKRVLEEPVRKASGKVEVCNHHSKCRSMTCNNVGVFQSHLTRIKGLIAALRAMQAVGDPLLTGEMVKMIEAYDAYTKNKVFLYDWGKCVGIGDLWIHLDSIQSGSTALITRNYKESNVLCKLLGIELVLPE